MKKCITLTTHGKLPRCLWRDTRADIQETELLIWRQCGCVMPTPFGSFQCIKSKKTIFIVSSINESLILTVLVVCAQTAAVCIALLTGSMVYTELSVISRALNFHRTSSSVLLCAVMAFPWFKPIPFGILRPLYQIVLDSFWVLDWGLAARGGAFSFKLQCFCQ